MTQRMAWLVPLTGVAFVALLIVGFLVGGETPDPTEDSAAEIISFYADNETLLIVSGVIEALAAALLVFFGAYLRVALQRPDGDGRVLSLAAFAGALILAMGLAIDATITFALVNTIDDLEPAAAQALSALYTNDYAPFGLGSLTFLLAAGLAIVRYGSLPKWLGWVAIVFAVTAVSPIGFIAFLGMGVIVAIMSVLLSLRQRNAPAQPA